MADVAILAQQVQATPNGYTIPGGQEIILKSIRVAYNGAGAGGSFVPVLQLVAPGPTGQVVSEYPLGSTLAAGASADVTWFPGVVAAASGSGIQFDQTQAGTWLEAEATGQPPAGGFGVEIIASGAPTAVPGHKGGWLLWAKNGAPINLLQSGLTADTPEPAFYMNTDGNMEQDSSGTMEFVSGTDSIFSGGGLFICRMLPNADPGVSGALWNSAGTVKVSP